jgi:hypothetical protein
MMMMSSHIHSSIVVAFPPHNLDASLLNTHRGACQTFDSIFFDDLLPPHDNLRPSPPPHGRRRQGSVAHYSHAVHPQQVASSRQNLWKRQRNTNVYSTPTFTQQSCFLPFPLCEEASPAKWPLPSTAVIIIIFPQVLEASVVVPCGSNRTMLEM